MPVNHGFRRVMLIVLSTFGTLVICTTSAVAQTGCITGLVIDETGRPRKHIKVEAVGTWAHYQAWTDANGSKVTAIGGQNAIDLAPFSNGGHRAVNESQPKFLESCVELKSAHNIRRERQLVFVARARIKHLSDQLTHGRPLPSKEVIDFGEDQPRHDNEARGG